MNKYLVFKVKANKLYRRITRLCWGALWRARVGSCVSTTALMMPQCREPLLVVVVSY